MVIYDDVLPWVLDVVKKSGLEGAPFLTQSCMVNSINYHAYEGALSAPTGDQSLVSLPTIKALLWVDDFPSFVSSLSYYPAVARLVLGQFSNFEEAECSFVNTMDMLEIEGFR